MFSKYLYIKAISSNTRFVPVMANKEEIDFLKRNNIMFYKEGELYYIDSDKVKSLFCH